MLPGVLVFLTVLICVVGQALDGTDGNCHRMEMSSSLKKKISEIHRNVHFHHLGPNCVSY